MYQCRRTCSLRAYQSAVGDKCRRFIVRCSERAVTYLTDIDRGRGIDIDIDIDIDVCVYIYIYKEKVGIFGVLTVGVLLQGQANSVWWQGTYCRGCDRFYSKICASWLQGCTSPSRTRKGAWARGASREERIVVWCYSVVLRHIAFTINFQATHDNVMNLF